MWHQTLLTVLFYLINYDLLITATGECRNLMYQDCFCGKAFYLAKERLLVNCTDQKFTNSSMLKDLPEETEVLIFRGNNLKILSWSDFGEANIFSRLKIVDFSSNNIRRIKGEPYLHVPNLETLILNNNSLECGRENSALPQFLNFAELEELHLINAFANKNGLKLNCDLQEILRGFYSARLSIVHLEHNGIEYFRDPNIFCDLPNLRELYLGQNLLSGMNFSVKCLKLKYLDLEQNKIAQLNEVDLNAWERLRRFADFTVNIRGNPFDCDCVENLNDWLLATKVLVRYKEELQCETSGDYQNIINLMDIQQESTSTAAVVLILAFICSCFGVVYMYKDKIKETFFPMLGVTSMKVQYNIIDSGIV